jgi:hypothetical protein
MLHMVRVQVGPVEFIKKQKIQPLLQGQPKFKLSHLQGTMTGHIYNTATILSQQRQKFLCHFHVTQKVDVDLLFNNFISLPFEFTKTHDTSIVNQRIKS